MTLIILIVILLLLFGGLPIFPHSRGYGWGPSGIIGVILVIFLILWLTGHLGALG